MKKNIVFSLWLMVSCFSTPQMASTGLSIKPFEVDSYQKIRALHRTEPFLMVFWSLDCPPCIDELFLLGRFHKQYPQAKLIMVSTDSIQVEDEIKQLMSEHDLHDLEHWVFASDPVQAIRYAIDPNWYGELPRSYFHRHNERQAMSGRLDEHRLSTWFKTTVSGAKGL